MSGIFHSSGTTILAKLGRIDRRDSTSNHLSISVFHVDTDQETPEIWWDLASQLGIRNLGNGSQHSSSQWSNLGYSDLWNRDPLFQAPISSNKRGPVRNLPWFLGFKSNSWPQTKPGRGLVEPPICV
jgi:hypothetical protein